MSESLPVDQDAAARLQRIQEGLDFVRQAYRDGTLSALNLAHHASWDDIEWLLTQLTTRTQERDEAREALTWQPIETAPKDATPVLGFERSERSPQVMRYTGAYWTSIPGGYACHPTHWMPLPSPSKAPKEATE